MDIDRNDVNKTQSLTNIPSSLGGVCQTYKKVENIKLPLPLPPNIRSTSNLPVSNIPVSNLPVSNLSSSNLSTLSIPNPPLSNPDIIPINTMNTSTSNINVTTPIAYPTIKQNKIEDDISIDENDAKLLDTEYTVEFNDGYTLRTLLEYFKLTNSQGNFIYSADGISYAQQNPDKSLLNIAEIYGWELPKYKYSSELEFTPQGINFVSVTSTVKAIRKKSRVIFFKKRNTIPISVQLIGASGSQNTNVSMIIPQKIKYENIQVGEDEDETNPLCTVAMPEFIETCTGLGNVEAKDIVILIYPEGMYLTGYTDTGEIGRVGRFGTVPAGVGSDNESTPKKMFIKATHFKHLSKLNNLSPSGAVKIYFYEIMDNRFLRIIFHIGTFGKLKVYLRCVTKD